MRTYEAILATLISAAVFSLASAAEISGTVRSVKGDEVTIQSEGTGSPVKGDRVTVFFHAPNSDDEIVIGFGKVVAADGGTVRAKIDKLYGELAVDQLARIGSQPATAIAISALTKSGLIGDWQGPQRIMRYAADGTFYSVDARKKSNLEGHWKIEGEKLIRHSTKGQAAVLTILELDETDLSLQDAKGQVFRLTRITP